MRHHLYRLYADGDLLYVGITWQLPTRFNDHRKKTWWAEVTHGDVDTYPSRDEAAAAERAAIRRERPIYNVAHNEGNPDRRPWFYRHVRQRGTCPSCRTVFAYAPAAFGLPAAMHAHKGYPDSRCPGSGRPPLEVG